MKLKDVRAQKFPSTDFFLKLATQKGKDILLPKRQTIFGVTDFVLEGTCPENTLNLKERASLADKATASVSPKYCNLAFEMKYSPLNIV